MKNSDDLNLIKILSKVPIGTRLYTTVFGYVTLTKIYYHDGPYPIEITYKYKNLKEPSVTGLTANGRYCYNEDTDCIIFPSKEQRDWKKFEEELNNKK